MNATAAGRKASWVFGGTCVMAALLVLPVQRQIDRLTSNPTIDPDLLYFDSPKALKLMALGYDSLAADIYWMRTIQYYGRREEAARRLVRYKNLATLLEITTTLDPDLIDAYRAGSGLLAEPDPLGAGRPDQALQLLERGIRLHPFDWRLYFDKGFIYYWHTGNPVEAGQVWLAASRLEGAPHWMESLAAMAMSKGGAIVTARALWQRQYESPTRPEVRENARNHLASIQMDEDIWTLEFLIERYRLKTGRLPIRFADLVRAGFLISTPLDPSGIPYRYDPTEGKITRSPDSRVRYLKIPYDYEKVFKERLLQRLGPP